MDLACPARLALLRPLTASLAWPTAAGPAQAQQAAFDRRTDRLAARCAAAWAEVGAALDTFGADISLPAKLERERRADGHLAEIESLLRQCPASPAKRGPWREDLLKAARRIAGAYVAGDADGPDRLLTTEAVEATRQFVREARAFAPDITDRSLFQALRNLWVTHSVQLFLQSPVALSPALFAYSLLYPWTDNRLDDPQLARAEKVAFGDWLTRRLKGIMADPRDLHAEQVSRLVGLIEQRYPRPEFPEVYLSLQAIHQAQMRSLDQQDVAQMWDKKTLLDLSIVKGGTSVLTDACLVRGTLTGEEAEFMFAYGVVLQLMDDLQDLRDDLANGHATIFTRQARRGSLDDLTARLWGFTQKVLWGFSRFASAQPSALKSLIQENLRLLLLQAVAGNQEFYTPRFVAVLEAAAPVRFRYLARQEKTLAGRCSRVLASIRQRRRLDSVFELLD